MRSDPEPRACTSAPRRALTHTHTHAPSSSPSKKKNAEKLKISIAKLAEEEAAQLAAERARRAADVELAASIGIIAKDGGDEDFISRQDAMTKRLEDARATGAAKFEYDHLDAYLECGACKARQSFEEWRAKARKCPKEACKGALFRPRRVWSEVQKSFLDRWTAGIALGEKRLAKIAAETMPPFRLLKRHVFDKETGEMKEEDIVQPDWDECAEHFFARQQEAIDRVEARKAAADDAAKKASEKIVIAQIKTNPYKFTKPLPDFYARQLASLESKNLSFEERLAKLQG
jgi:hypothetical protein